MRHNILAISVASLFLLALPANVQADLEDCLTQPTPGEPIPTTPEEIMERVQDTRDGAVATKECFQDEAPWSITFQGVGTAFWWVSGATLPEGSYIDAFHLTMVKNFDGGTYLGGSFIYIGAIFTATCEWGAGGSGDGTLLVRTDPASPAGNVFCGGDFESILIAPCVADFYAFNSPWDDGVHISGDGTGTGACSVGNDF